MSENEQRLTSENQALKAMVEQLMGRVVELEARIKQNSGNSSKSPSSDMGRKRKPPVVPSGRKRGGQSGHAGKSREQVPPEEVDEVKDADPESCERCGESLEQAPWRDAVIRQFCESSVFRTLITELLLTPAGTARKRGVDLLEWLTQAMEASHAGVPAPAFNA